MKTRRLPALITLIIVLTFSMNPAMANQSVTEQCATVGTAAALTSVVAIAADCLFFSCFFTITSASTTAAATGVGIITAVAGGIATTGALGCIGGALENSMSN